MSCQLTNTNSYSSKTVTNTQEYVCIRIECHPYCCITNNNKKKKKKEEFDKEALKHMSMKNNNNNNEKKDVVPTDTRCSCF